jgi:UDP-N-acetylmuramoylalanine--D-glutamate ligase
MNELSGQPVLVLGLGESGLAMARFLAERGAVLRVADTREAPPMLAALRAELPQAQFHGGQFDAALLDGAVLVAISPGLSPTHSEAAPLVKAAVAAKIPVAGEIELFAWTLAFLKADRGYAPQVIGVTGTNGKTTTTRLVGLLIESAGKSVAVAGNISPSALATLMERTAAGTLPEVWVLELSSFQLATTSSLACDAATVLNVTQDHLDWHGTLDAYAKAKARIFAKDAVQVLNRDDPLVIAMAAKKTAPVTFGASAPAHADEYGLVHDGGMTWLAYAEDLSSGQRKRKAAVDLPGVPGEVFVHRLMPADALRIRGRHNALNALAALALTRAIGCPLAPMLHALREYRGEAHRVELVAIIDGVEFYDDSKGTNVGATVAALDGLGAEGKRLAVILGGDGKGQDFAPLAAPLARHARAVALIGCDADAVAAALGDAPYPVERCADLPAAVAACARHARAGDAVLLSPACASLDMFRNYKHRAEVFVEAVRELAAQKGQPC